MAGTSMLQSFAFFLLVIFFFLSIMHGTTMAARPLKSLGLRFDDDDDSNIVEGVKKSKYYYFPSLLEVDHSGPSHGGEGHYVKDFSPKSQIEIDNSGPSHGGEGHYSKDFFSTSQMEIDRPLNNNEEPIIKGVMFLETSHNNKVVTSSSIMKKNINVGDVEVHNSGPSPPGEGHHHHADAPNVPSTP
ncbi:cold shock protein CS66 [Senna tora]|uniref:Cold shock protein CS66 n=1 Tax=Senna tora TaxID=362788 RepID=A0A834SV03_9FABA|nr:cold shock protein CS66 [Senna tora]